ncbi:domain of Kin17 curved DNA-binding protein-domain-containing protein [Gorgonomyces haynaldii]|nr:domain of Kin17 curved DNA-binding protein-domain-containing protein [Gorgonomyces haynaldii]
MPPKKHKFTGSTRMQGFNSVRKIWNFTNDELIQYYCQMCEKQAIDAHGWDRHCESDYHMKQMKVFAENPEFYIEKFSKEFHSQFIRVLSNQFQTREVKVDDVYKELVQDRHHTHLNATKWQTMDEYLKYVGKQGICRVQEREDGFYIKWIDRSMTQLDKETQQEKRRRTEISEEQRERRLLEEQIQKQEIVQEHKPTAIETKIPIKLDMKIQKPQIKKLQPKSLSKLFSAK